MAFPRTDRVSFEKNPLIEVTIQLHFPPILMIEQGLSEPLQNLQESLRKTFPFYGSERDLRIDFAQHPQNTPHQASESRLKHIFFTENKAERVILANNSILFAVSEYKNWEDFQSKAKMSFENFTNYFQPTFYERLGLRYIDAIHFNQLGCDAESLHTLLNPIVAGLYSDDEVNKSEIEDSQSTIQVKVHDDGTPKKQVGSHRAKYGIATNLQTKETSFLIDSDFFVQEHFEAGDLDAVFKRGNIFHNRANDFFQWCISEKLANEFLG